MNHIPVNLQDSAQLRQRLSSYTVKKTDIIATADVKSLYTNVPLKHGVEVVSKFVEQHMEKINMLGISHADFVLILKTVTEAGYFRFNDQFYQQLDGLGMGVKAAPAFAIIYVYVTVEKPLLENDYTFALISPDNVNKPNDLMTIESWNRYVDDCLMVGDGTEEDIQKLFSYINRLNPHIQFTYECSHKHVDFLDLTIHLDKDSETLQYELFIKPTSLGIFLNYNSGHPRSTILNSAQNELSRALRNGSTNSYQDRGVNKIKDMLKNNDFPEHVITQLHQRATTKPTDTTSKIGDKRQYLCLPYISEQHKRKVYQIMRNNNLLESTKITFKPDNKLKDILTRSALQPTQCNKQSNKTCYKCDDMCMTKNITYKLTCSLCSLEYVGETGRYKRNRCWEHFKSVRDGTRATAMGNHYIDHHSSIIIPDTATNFEPFLFETLRVCKDYTDRQLWQSFYIKSLSPIINTQLSSDTDSWQKTTWAIM